MGKIKTRETVKNVKAIDKAAVAGERMKKGNALFFFGHGSDVPLSFFCHGGLRWCC